MGRGQGCLWGTTLSNHLTTPCLSFPTASCCARRLRVRALQQESDPLCPHPPSTPDLGGDNPGPLWQGPPGVPQHQDPRPRRPISFQDCQHRRSGALGRGGCLGWGTSPPLAGGDREPGRAGDVPRRRMLAPPRSCFPPGTSLAHAPAPAASPRLLLRHC